MLTYIIPTPNNGRASENNNVVRPIKFRAWKIQLINLSYGVSLCLPYNKNLYSWFIILYKFISEDMLPLDIDEISIITDIYIFICEGVQLESIYFNYNVEHGVRKHLPWFSFVSLIGKYAWWSSVPNLAKVSLSPVKFHESKITTVDLLLWTKGWLKWRKKDLFCRLMETKVNYKHVTIINLDFRGYAAPFGWYPIHLLHKLIFEITNYANYVGNDGKILSSTMAL